MDRIDAGMDTNPHGTKYAPAHPMGPQERRRFPRYDVGKLSGVLDGFRVFETLKLGAGGALIRVPADLGLGQRVHVSMELDDAIFRSPALVVFVGPDLGERDMYRVGLSFAGTSEDDLVHLQQFIERGVASGDLK
jgi:PilZ domain-containing protein